MRRFIPNFILSIYHFLLAKLAAFWYGFPSEKMVVIGVTGTNGKSSTVNILGKLLQDLGYKVGWTSTMTFCTGDKEWLNDTKMTMLGRFQTQRLLREMVKNGCQYAIVETSSEGLKQWRHVGINYDVAVFLNLSEDHLEAHGSYEEYRRAKEGLFGHLGYCRRKFIDPLQPSLGKGRGFPSLPRGSTRRSKVTISKTIVVNGDDAAAEYFLRYSADKKVSVSKRDFSEIKTSLMGPGIEENMRMAIGTAEILGISREKLLKAAKHLVTLPGRFELIGAGQKFRVVVDYAHTVEAMKQLYEFVEKLRREKFFTGKIIHLLGGVGGGRDRAKRKIFGQMAGRYAEVVIATNEDPYDDDPMEIIHEVAEGARAVCHPHPILEILDRREAIRKALSLAESGDLVLITGKGSEQAICGPRGLKTPWDDRVVAREILGKLRTK